MKWYAASIIIAIRPESGYSEDGISVYENVVLFQADSPKRAIEMAKAYGKAEAEANDDFTIDDEPATFEFLGVRKLVDISNPHPAALDTDPPTTGTEITYSEFVVPDEASLKKLVEGDDVEVTYLS